MANVEPLDREQIPALEGVMASSEAMMGFVPNSMLTMAHMPQMAMAFSLKLCLIRNLPFIKARRCTILEKASFRL